MEQKLTTKEKQELKRLHKLERDGRIRDRIKAVLLYDKGYSYSEIAIILLLDDETIRRHVEEYFTQNKLKPENGGSTGYLSISESSTLKSHLQEITYLYVKDICKYVKQEFNKSYSISGMTKWLKANGFRYKKPHGVPAKANKKKQEEFIKVYTQLKEKAGDKEPIYFADSVHPQHQTQLVYGWILKGERKSIATTGQQKRLHITGGICLEGHKIIYDKADKIDNVSIQSFLYKLRSKYPENNRIHVIWDNASYHKKEEVKKCAKKLNIILNYLPAHSPNLNPIERLWKILHEHVTYNKYYSTFSEFTDSVLHFLRHVGKKKHILRSRITDNFQILNSPNFAS